MQIQFLFTRLYFIIFSACFSLLIFAYEVILVLEMKERKSEGERDIGTAISE